MHRDITGFGWRRRCAALMADAIEAVFPGLALPPGRMVGDLPLGARQAVEIARAFSHSGTPPRIVVPGRTDLLARRPSRGRASRPCQPLRRRRRRRGVHLAQTQRGALGGRPRRRDARRQRRRRDAGRRHDARRARRGHGPRGRPDRPSVPSACRRPRPCSRPRPAGRASWPGAVRSSASAAWPVMARPNCSAACWPRLPASVSRAPQPWCLATAWPTAYSRSGRSRATSPSAPCLRSVVGPLLDPAREAALAADWRRRLGLVTPDVNNPILSLSGGNQQKALFAPPRSRATPRSS